MFKFLLSLLIVITLSPTVLLMSFSYNCDYKYEADETDLELSKRRFLISDAPSYADLKQKNCGVMTLCIKENKGNDSCELLTYAHAALVFEYFSPEAPEQISLCMVHSGRQEDCCGFGGKQITIIDNRADTLKKVYRVIKTAGAEKCFLPATYTRYASWIMPNDALLKGLSAALKKNVDHGNCVKFVTGIMKETGLQNVNFGYWLTTPENLKIIVTHYSRPLPNWKVFSKVKLKLEWASP